MTTDLALVTNSYHAIQQFAETASALQPIAEVLAQTSFVPAVYRNKPTEITAAIMFGAELGFDPMSALQALVPIEGRPSLSAVAMRGLAIANGVEFDLRESTNTRCVYAAKPAYSKQWTEVVWDIERARTYGLDQKANWKKQPKAMLIARATSEVCRLVAANLYIGCPYSSEEMQDGPDDARWANGGEGPPSEPVKARTVKRNAAAAKVQASVQYAEPDPEPVSETPKEIGYSTEDPEKRLSPEPPVERENPVQPNTRKALMASFNDINIRSRDDRLKIVSDIVGREIHSVNMLTEDEAQTVLDGVKGVATLKAAAVADDEWPEPSEVPGQ